MNAWTTVLLACAASFATKLLGYVIPSRWLDGERTTKVMNFLPVALLAALVAIQTFTGSGGRPAFDARAGGLAVAIVLLVLRAPFIVVVIAAALAAALLRYLGIG